jgi:hypothetical protein
MLTSVPTGSVLAIFGVYIFQYMKKGARSY